VRPRCLAFIPVGMHVEAGLAELYVAPKGQMCAIGRIEARHRLVLELEPTREDPASLLLILLRRGSRSSAPDEPRVRSRSTQAKGSRHGVCGDGRGKRLDLLSHYQAREPPVLELRSVHSSVGGVTRLLGREREHAVHDVGPAARVDARIVEARVVPVRSDAQIRRNVGRPCHLIGHDTHADDANLHYEELTAGRSRREHTSTIPLQFIEALGRNLLERARLVVVIAGKQIASIVTHVVGKQLGVAAKPTAIEVANATILTVCSCGANARF
jgi:hypothetical protein